MKTQLTRPLVLLLGLFLESPILAVPLSLTFHGTVSSVAVSTDLDPSPLVAVGDSVAGSVEWWHPGAGLIGTLSDGHGSMTLPSGTVIGDPFRLALIETSTAWPDRIRVGFHDGLGPVMWVGGREIMLDGFGLELPRSLQEGAWRDYVELTTADITRLEVYGHGWHDGRWSRIVASLSLDSAAFTCPLSEVPDFAATLGLLALGVAFVDIGRRCMV